MTHSPTDDPTTTENAKPSPSFLWKWIKRLIVTGFLLAIALGITAWFSRDWIAAKSHEALKAELSRRNIHADYGASGFSLVRGLVFSDVKIHRTAEKNDPLLSISDIAVGFNPFKIASGEGRAARITSQAATLTAHDPEHSVEASALDLDLKLNPANITIDRLTGQIVGVELDLSGDFSTKKTSPRSEDEAEKKEDKETPGFNLEPIARVLAIIAAEPKGAPPRIRAHVTRSDDGKMKAKGSISGKSFAWKGVAIDSLDVDFQTIEGASAAPVAAVRIPSLNLGYGGNRLTGAGTYTIESGVLTVDALDSRIDLVRLIKTISPDQADNLAALSFSKPPAITLRGAIPTRDPKRSDVKGTVSAADLTIAMGGDKKLAFSNVNADFTMADGKIQSDNLTASTLGGSAKASVAVTPFTKPVRLETDLTLADLSAQQVSALAGYQPGGDKPQHGTMFLSFAGGGSPSLTGLNGSGRLDVNGADLISVPIFRKLVPSFKKLINGFMGRQDATMVTSTYRLEQGVLTAQDIQIKETMVAIDGTATVDFNKRWLEATAKAQTKGVTKLITGLAGKALEVEASGSFDNFTWEFKNIPGLKDVTNIGKLGGPAGELLKTGADGVGGVAGGILKGVAGLGKKNDVDKDTATDTATEVDKEKDNEEGANIGKLDDAAGELLKTGADGVGSVAGGILKGVTGLGKNKDTDTDNVPDNVEGTPQDPVPTDESK